MLLTPKKVELKRVRVLNKIIISSNDQSQDSPLTLEINLDTEFALRLITSISKD
jgi:hypothetical protein